MKYILIIGAKDAGKSTTINEVCKRLRPDKVWQLIPNPSDSSEYIFDETANTITIENGTYLIEVKGKMILVSAGSPTEQGIKITVLIEICIKLKIEITLCLVAMRLFEKKEGFDTRKELSDLGESLYEQKIYRIASDDFKNNTDWKKRIEEIIDLIKENI